MVLNQNLHRRFSALALFAIACSVSLSARAEILFEGYSKVMLSGEHIGFAVQRDEFDPKKQEFTSTTYIKTSVQGGNLTESQKDRADAKLKPISYQYTTIVNGKSKTIDATFKGDMMTAVVNEGGKTQTLRKTLQKGVFLSGFLAYLMLQGKDGIKPQVKYGYLAIEEETAGIFSGEAYVASAEKYNGQSAFKVLNTFHDAQFVSYVTHKGEVLATKSPVQGVSTELVANIQEATKGLSLNTSALETLFGGLPLGKENAVARAATSAPTTAASTADAPATATTATPLGSGDDTSAADKKKAKLYAPPINPPPADNAKKSGVPAGEGLEIKTAPPVKAPAPDKSSDSK